LDPAPVAIRSAVLDQSCDRNSYRKFMQTCFHF